MRTVENECVGCPPELGCLGTACPNRNVERIYCDTCGDEADYEYNGGDYCESCLLEKLIADGIISGVVE